MKLSTEEALPSLVMDVSHASKSYLSSSSNPAWRCVTKALIIAGLGVSNAMKLARAAYDVPALAANAMDT